MRRLLLLFLISFCSSFLSAQQKDFEGIIAYKTALNSKIGGIDAVAWKHLMALGDSTISFIKGPNIKSTSGFLEYYNIPARQKTYYKFKGIDTLFYVAYTDGPASIKDIEKKAGHKKIAGYDCGLLTFKADDNVRKLFYAPHLYRNPQYDENNKIGGADMLARETASLCLESSEEYPFFTMMESAYRVESAAIDENIFILPDLPEKPFDIRSIRKDAEFPGKAGGWERYLSTNIKPELVAKYLKIPKGADSASQTARVNFLISEKGEPVNIAVINKDEVHPRLAAEALRIISESPAWKPATVLGKKTIFNVNQSVTFRVTK